MNSVTSISSKYKLCPLRPGREGSNAQSYQADCDRPDGTKPTADLTFMYDKICEYGPELIHSLGNAWDQVTHIAERVNVSLRQSKELCDSHKLSTLLSLVAFHKDPRSH